MERKEPVDPGQSWLTRLVTAIDSAVTAGWPQTLRLLVLLVVLALLLALLMTALKQGAIHAQVFGDSAPGVR